MITIKDRRGDSGMTTNCTQFADGSMITINDRRGDSGMTTDSTPFADSAMTTISTPNYLLRFNRNRPKADRYTDSLLSEGMMIYD